LSQAIAHGLSIVEDVYFIKASRCCSLRMLLESGIDEACVYRMDIQAMRGRDSNESPVEAGAWV
jgi:hypothetical protein